MSTLTRLRAAAGLENVSGRNLTEVAKTLAFVVPMTLLIWVYAERASTKQSAVSVALTFTVPDPTLIATIKDSVSDQITVGLNGPRGQIDRLKARIDEIMHGRLQVQLPPAYATPGDHDLPLDRLLTDDPFFFDSGVAVDPKNTSPLTIKVNVDKVDTREAVVELPRDPGQPLENVKFNPARVTFRGPHAAIKAQFPDRDATVGVRLPSPLPTGQVRDLDVPLVLPANPAITAAAQQVTVSYDVISRKITGLVPQVRIDVQRPLGQDGKSRVTMRGPPVLNNVSITGPEAEVRDYAGDKATKLLTGVISVDPSDIGKTDSEKEVRFPTLPKGIEIDGGPYSVKVDVSAVGETDR